ncbi:SpoIIE family protein phosphatase [Geothrix sp. SG200]|uniref:SpoIIE family protein phosphatase n=1 Tax=Geothrix sp. SG200 TaxID=2922865 RepID=UPI001FACF287|nr:SpoIIE family protein phosphatase [Geothrix sp. SG200]
MAAMTLHVPGLDPLLLEGEDGRAWHFGRSHQNEVVIADGALSRRHARIVMHRGVPFLEDLDSRNGTFINGERVHAPRPLRGGDEVHLGSIHIRVTGGTLGPEVRFRDESGSSPQSSVVLPIDEAWRTWLPTGAPDRMGAVIRDLQDLSLELIKDVPPGTLLDHVLDHLWNQLHPWRAAILLSGPDGNLKSVASRASEGHAPISLSTHLVESALARRQAVLFRDVEAGTASPSLLLSGITTAIVAPLEFEGAILGLLYLDAKAPRPPFTEQDLGLASTFAHLASAKLEQVRMQEEAQRRRSLDQELDLARHIQQGLLPGLPPEIPGYELHGNNLPSRQVSGDLFGWWLREDGRWLLALADVSGKGLGPGLLMASLSAFLEAFGERDIAPDDLAFHLSRSLARHTDGKRFVTAFLLLFEPATGEVTYTNAGHNPGYLVSADGTFRALESQGLPLAMLPGQPYGSGSFRLEPGDLLALYTDGVTEVAAPNGEEYGEDRLQAFLRTSLALGLDAIDAGLMADLEAHAKGAPFTDDRTILLLRRTASSSG